MFMMLIVNITIITIARIFNINMDVIIIIIICMVILVNLTMPIVSKQLLIYIILI